MTRGRMRAHPPVPAARSRPAHAPRKPAPARGARDAGALTRPRPCVRVWKKHTGSSYRQAAGNTGIPRAARFGLLREAPDTLLSTAESPDDPVIATAVGVACDPRNEAGRDHRGLGRRIRVASHPTDAASPLRLVRTPPEDAPRRERGARSMRAVGREGISRFIPFPLPQAARGERDEEALLTPRARPTSPCRTCRPPASRCRPWRRRPRCRRGRRRRAGSRRRRAGRRGSPDRRRRSRRRG